jgi:hypothetical protein
MHHALTLNGLNHAGHVGQKRDVVRDKRLVSARLHMQNAKREKVTNRREHRGHVRQNLVDRDDVHRPRVDRGSNVVAKNRALVERVFALVRRLLVVVHRHGIRLMHHIVREHGGQAQHLRENHHVLTRPRLWHIPQKICALFGLNGNQFHEVFEDDGFRRSGNGHVRLLDCMFLTPFILPDPDLAKPDPELKIKFPGPDLAETPAGPGNDHNKMHFKKIPQLRFHGQFYRQH